MLNLEKNKKYLLACSYGPDSMALFDMLLKEGYRFAVAHVNYHLRNEADDEEIDLRNYCLTHGVGIYVKSVRENLGDNNLEAKCRDIRYNFFIDVVKQNGFDALLVAHQEDDLIETYLMQKKRKNLVNYFGIKEISYFTDVEIIRPLLKYRKKELLIYCRMFSVPYAIDKTNLEDHFLRNQLRHSVVEKMTPEERKEILQEIDNENQKLAEIFEKISNIKSNKIEEYNRLNDIEFLYAIVLLGRKIKSDFTISKEQGEELRKVLLCDKPNVSLTVDELCFVKEYDAFSIREDIEACDFEYVLEKPDKLDTPYFSLDFTRDPSRRNVSPDDYPLTIRNARPGDAYRILDYEKEIRRLFIDWKMPVSLRNRWPVIVNKDGVIIYVPRYLKDFSPSPNDNFSVKF
ncbi:MAG: tRNA lysidine(34) synthetase TilS [Bacilli bacterium]|nr:tRNA lysidine(34) synthetase TilS [Bacilli bacterium]